MIKMLLSQLLRDVPVIGSYTDVQISDVTDNSMNITPGCLFVCIRGMRFDGHNFAADALKQGAAAVVCERDLFMSAQVLTQNTRAAYALICKNFFGRACDELSIAGITGTNGKTTTSFIVKDIMNALGEKTGLIGTVKNMVGDESIPTNLTTPDPYIMHGLFRRMVDSGIKYCIMEASSQALDQRRLEGIRFSVGVFTNLTQDHLDYHGSADNYIEAKKRLFSASDRAVVNADDESSGRMLEGLDISSVSFSVSSDSAQLRARDIVLEYDHVQFTFCCAGGVYPVRLGIPGGFSVYNALAAMGTVLALGKPIPDTARALECAKPVLGRLETVKCDTPYTVLIDYAHTPDGLEKAICAVKGFVKGKLITVFGCGGDRDNKKRPLMGGVAQRLSDIVVVTSDNPRTEQPQAIIDEILTGVTPGDPNVYVEADRTKAIRIALSLAGEGDIVLLAGKGNETYQIVGTERRHFDEREIVAGILSGEISE